MAGQDKRNSVAYMQQADEEDNLVGEVTYAASTIAPASSRQRPSTHRSRSEKPRRTTSSSTPSPLTSETPPQPHSILKRDAKSKGKEKSSSKDKERRSSSKARPVEVRPTPRHAKTMPVTHPSSASYPASYDQAGYYGLPPPPPPDHTRPHLASQARPASYYAGASRPPVSSNRWWQGTAGAMGTTYPPVQYAMTPMAPPPFVAHQQVDYFPAVPPPQPLLDRFNRPPSAFGSRRSHDTPFTPEFEGESPRLVTRRPSLTSRKAAKDRVMMPPPPRPSTTRPITRSSAFAPPPMQRPVSCYEDEDFAVEDQSVYQSYQDYQGAAPLSTYDYEPRMAGSRTRRPSVGAPTMLYDLGNFQTEVAKGPSRRNSYFGRTPSGGSSGLDEQIHLASRYQDQVHGNHTLPLTEELLRKASKTGTRTRSTKSSASASRDESDYKRSATTRTSVDNDDMHIIVKGLKSVRIGSTELQCDEGTEVHINQRQPSNGTIRAGGSDDNLSSIYDERTGRHHRPSIRSRAASQAGSYSRTPVGHEAYGYPITRLPSGDFF